MSSIKATREGDVLLVGIDRPEKRNALDKAMASGKPAVVDVVSDINGIAPRAWTPS